MSPRVSVVVATYDPPRHLLAALLDSLDRQSMPTSDFEVVLVDDGSTGDTADFLERYAAARPNVEVIRTPNSGWPGKPRNLGLDRAQGEFVFFADHDDYFGDEALSRMYAYASEHGSDVLVARESRVGRGPVGTHLFTKNRPKVDLTWHPLLSLLTPHKLFRRDFLVEHGIRFPEGPRRLEDHAFVLPAYFAADTISVLADYACYFWVFEDNDNNNSRGIEPDYYYPFIEEILDLVEAQVPAGHERDRLLSHWYSVKVIRFIESAVRTENHELVPKLLTTTKALAHNRFSQVDEFLPPGRRVLSSLLRSGDRDRLLAITAQIVNATARPVATSLHWEDGVLVVELEMTLRYGDGQPVVFQREGDRVFWVPPVDVSDVVPADTMEVTDALEHVRVSLMLRHRTDGTNYDVPGVAEISLVEQPNGLVLSASVRSTLDVRRVALGHLLAPGRWSLRALVRGLGIDTVDAVPVNGPLPGPALVDGRAVRVYRTAEDNLGIVHDCPEVKLAQHAKPTASDVTLAHTASGSRLVLTMPRVHAAGAVRRPAALRIGGLRVPAELVAGENGTPVRLESWFSALPGLHRLSVVFDREVVPLPIRLDVGSDGSVQPRRGSGKKKKKAVAAPQPPGPTEPLRRVVRRVPGLTTAVRRIRPSA